MTAELRQAWDLPSKPWPITIIGAGAIVRTAHLPAYRRLGLPVAGLFDLKLDAAAGIAREFGVPIAHRTLSEACRAGDGGGVVFDVAVPGDQVLGVLQCLPEGSAVLIQKPMGENLEMAREIRDMCRERQLVAAMISSIWKSSASCSPTRSALALRITSNSMSRRAAHSFSPSLAVPYRMLKVITANGSRGCTGAAAGGCRSGFAICAEARMGDSKTRAANTAERTAAGELRMRGL
jgi:hypothetical protein